MQSFIINLVFLLVAAKLIGEICERIDFPSVLGYILAGILAGPMLLNLVAADTIQPFAELGIILMLFVTGFTQGNISELMKNARPILITSTLGFIGPFLASLLMGLILGMDFNHVLLMTLAVASTDSGITIRSIQSMGKMGTKAGKIMLGVTVSDGILGLIVFTVIMSYLSVGNIDVFELGKVALSIILFLGLFVIIQKIVPFFINKLNHLSVEQAEFSFAFIFMILLAIIAEYFGLHGIVGAFLAGTILARSKIASTDFLEKISSISYAIFIPLFFVWAGLLLDIGAVTVGSFLIIGAVLIANSIAAFYAGKLSKLSDEDSLLMSISMLPRGDINLIIISIGIISLDMYGMPLLPKAVGEWIYSTVMLLVLFAAIITFILLKIFVKKEEVKT